MKKIFGVLIMMMISTFSYPQSFRPISDTEFEWEHSDDCYDSKKSLEIFKIVQNPPILRGKSKKQFYNELNQLIKKHTSKTSEELIIKIKLFTMVGQEICMGGIGVNEEINQELLNDIHAYLSAFKDFEYGSQMDKFKNCQSEIYIIIRKNKLEDIHFFNLNFE